MESIITAVNVQLYIIYKRTCFFITKYKIRHGGMRLCNIFGEKNKKYKDIILILLPNT